MNNNLFKKIILWAIVPLFLLGFWLFMSLFFASNYSLSVFVSGYSSKNIQNFKTDEFLKGQSITGEFRARENNLGIVAVRFFNFNRISKDSVIFEIKQKDQEKWFYENKYKVNQFLPNELFTFGFPIIPDSKNKEYLFRITSVMGEKGDAIGLSNLEPFFVTEFQFTKSELFSNKLQIPTFFVKKIFYSFSDINFAVSSLIYILPLILYLIWLILRKNLLKTQNYLLVYVFLLGTLIFILFMEDINRTSEVVLIILWIFLVAFYRFESSVSFLMAIIFLSATPILMLINQSLIAENAAIWAYFFLVIGTIEAIAEHTINLQNLIGYEVFLKENLTKIYTLKNIRKIGKNSLKNNYDKK